MWPDKSVDDTKTAPTQLFNTNRETIQNTPPKCRKYFWSKTVCTSNSWSCSSHRIWERPKMIWASAIATMTTAIIVAMDIMSRCHWCRDTDIVLSATVVSDRCYTWIFVFLFIRNEHWIAVLNARDLRVLLFFFVCGGSQNSMYWVGGLFIGVDLTDVSPVVNCCLSMSRIFSLFLIVRRLFFFHLLIWSFLIDSFCLYGHTTMTDFLLLDLVAKLFVCDFRHTKKKIH